jgi:iron complex transport system substrate-binding protein
MKILKPALVISLLFLFVSCGRFGNKQNETQKTNTTRIVCVSKQLNEIIFALGAGDKVVGVDLSSTYPPEIKNLPTVGYHRLLSTEGIISLNPTVVFHDGGIAPETVIPQLQKVGIPIKEFHSPMTFDSTCILIHTLAKEFDADKKADELCAKLDADMKKAAEKRKEYKTVPRVLIIHYGRQMNNYFVMGKKGNQNSLIEMAGGVNAADTSGFRLLSAESIVNSQPDVILATDFGFDRLGSEDKFVELPGIGLTPAAKNHKIFRIEEHDLVYFGPRTGEIVTMIMELIHK